MNLHNEFYDFRERVWRQLEKTVQEGCECIGDFPITLGDIHLPKTEHRSAQIIADTTNINIYGIIADPNYHIFPPKASPRSLNVIVNTITVFFYGGHQREVTPDLLSLQYLSTYLSGGYAAYENG
ncbi:MAG: hypothetical protein AAF570_00800 [Bacteroidota bacterium]